MLAGILDKKNYFTDATISLLGCDVRHLLSSARKIFRAWVYSASKMDPPVEWPACARAWPAHVMFTIM